MTRLLKFIYIILLLSKWTFSCAQDSANNIPSKNSLDLQLLGNKGFLSVGYNRTILRGKRIAFLLSPSLGFVPGVSDTAGGEVPSPRFLHVNFGTSLVYGRGRNKISAGLSYTRIIISDPYDVRPKSGYNRVLGEISYLRYFPYDGVALKISFTPILYDDGADDVSDTPIGLTLRISL